MSYQTAAANVHPFHCMMPSANPADTSDPLPVLRREMKLLLIEQELLRIELEQRRANEDEVREAKECILAYVERVEQLCVMEAEARKAMEFWQREAQRMAQERPRWSRWGWHFSAARAVVWSRWARVRSWARIARSGARSVRYSAESTSRLPRGLLGSSRAPYLHPNAKGSASAALGFKLS